MPKAGTVVEQSGIYWCTVCKFPIRVEKGETFPTCRNKCGRGAWEFVPLAAEKAEGFS
jgi:hypothetical protein